MAAARELFRVLTRRRGGYDGAVLHDVQLQIIATGDLVWAQTFTDRRQAEDFRRRVEADLEKLDGDEFRREHSVPSGA